MITGVILAAGTSTRMGRPKLLLNLGGLPVLQHVLNAAAASPLDEILVVMGPEAGDVASALSVPPSARLVTNSEFAEGQSTSLRAGLQAAGPGSLAAVIMLGDQPEVRPGALAAVVGEFGRRPGPVLQAAYRGRPAHPTLLARAIWSEVISGTADEGARAWIKLHPGARRLVEVGGDPPDDIDTAEDYERVKLRFEPA